MWTRGSWLYLYQCIECSRRVTVGWVAPLGCIADSSVRHLSPSAAIRSLKLTLGSVVLDAHAWLVKRLYTRHGGMGSPFGLYCWHLNPRNYPNCLSCTLFLVICYVYVCMCLCKGHTIVGQSHESWNQNALAGSQHLSWLAEESWEHSEMVMPWTGALHRSGISLRPYPDWGKYVVWTWWIRRKILSHRL